MKQGKVFNFGDAPLVKETENAVTASYERMEQGQQPAPQPEPAPAPAEPAEEQTKGVQAYIPMALYERLMMRKLRTKDTLGSMFTQAIKYWLDAQEAR